MFGDSTTEKPAGPAQASHDPETPPALIEFMATGWIDAPPAPQVHPQAARFAQRREALARAYPGTHLVIPAGREHVRANDTYFRFRTASDFAYLMGDGEPGAVLVLEPKGAAHRAILFAREHNRGKAEFFTDRTQGELWVGRHRGVEESCTYYGLDLCRPLAALMPYLEELGESGHPLRVVRTHNNAVDDLFEETDEDLELATHLSEMRLIKDEYELSELRKRARSPSADSRTRFAPCALPGANAKSKRRFGAGRASKPMTSAI